MKTKQVKSWSLSALHLYELCPHQYALSKWGGFPKKEPSWALANGIAIHSKMEHYLKGDIEGIPSELTKLSKEMKNLKRHNPGIEEELTLDKYWNPVLVDNAWSSPKTWLRGKIDARVNNLVIDLKTGKSYPKYAEQGELYSIGVMKAHPEYDEVDVEFWYNRTGEIESYCFFRSDMPDMIEVWEQRVTKLFTEKHWLPLENEYCKWCDFNEICPIFK